LTDKKYSAFMKHAFLFAPDVDGYSPEGAVVGQFEIPGVDSSGRPAILGIDMPDRSKKRPRDPNQLAYQIMLESTEQAPKYTPQEKPKNPAAVELGRLGGLKGGVARAAKLSPKERSQIAAKAAETRWGKKK
jgi:hypothetical protein